ncbi:MAG: KEOPS complex subunit Pcc1 [Candidatus Heimdallarchaeota archaeon]|nr:KEOPS complex subunit Pcc1 [Candidatus Heimdallarchaeota archaeon]MDH5647182.1 KEOPS complex subunit Pcc1 [Candidatus Heimdallarchaeota archaeon]
MKFKVSANIKLHDPDNIKDIEAALLPENKTMENGEIKTYCTGEFVVTELEGNMKIGTLINTLDDIIRTSILVQKVSESIDEFE